MIIVTTLIQLIGGLGLFLYGMQLMGDGLESVAGDKLKTVLEKVTNNRIIAVGIGAIVTAIIQSSSATTVMVVSFVNAGLMTLMQSVGVIMGANVGTTITAQLVSFKLDSIAPLFIGIGAISLLAVKNKKTRDTALIVLGFGLLFLGMGTMSDAMKPLSQSDYFKQIIMVVAQNRFLGILVGLGLTAVVQSSSATTGILIALAASGSITMELALPVILGCNIGTCVTALIASAGANKTAKKAALVHLFFNLAGVLIFIPFITPLVNFIQEINPGDVARQVANAHTIFNITVTIILLPFAKYLVMLVNKVMPGEDTIEKEGAMYLDKVFLETPSVAIGQVFKETVRMGELAKSNLELSMQSFMEGKEDNFKKIYKQENTINILEKEITDYLVQLSAYELPLEESKMLSTTFHIINDMERIGDHSKNIVELATEKIINNITLGEEANKELINMYDKTREAVELSIKCYAEQDVVAAMTVKEIEKTIDKYEKNLRENNINRLNKKICRANESTVFLDLISNLERIGDHASNIAESVS